MLAIFYTSKKPRQNLLSINKWNCTSYRSVMEANLDRLLSELRPPSTGQCPVGVGWAGGGWPRKLGGGASLDLLHHLNALQHMLLFPSPNNPFCFFFSFVSTLLCDLYKFELQDKKVSNIYLLAVYKFSWLSSSSYPWFQRETWTFSMFKFMWNLSSGFII